MDEGTPLIEVRSISVEDASALYQLDYDYETDRVYTLRVKNRLEHEADENGVTNGIAFAFELQETPVDPPIYRDLSQRSFLYGDPVAKLRSIEGGYVALANGKVAGGVLLNVEETRSIVRIVELIVGRQYRRYGIGSLLLRCAADWARKRDCWAVVLETQNTNFPAIQFYLRNGLEIWGMHQHFYPPGSCAHEIALFMGMRISAPSE
ncbi:ribosomal protein S18 acetylase RimI-like enzyme [Thermosporothrix hazakensis]|jgi:GNAT superfamily N-acetyltransferase|uniref:Ribosomal protein S18 acetylase RimI-like enzyme n=1 Tax=Thermosporothrix hazakensis TaxID=644383 RepID=A0A326UL13_THEHA|nr:GNAT family N-acetyltransferase [Thermosporothrix hazakensis]PZW33043.1 ribosomal protein S18 acetylase RimI-like enzyme [Thermosporothrix hazakensis]GCE49075.1 hypothetical protein KTH_39440 [Thermosporothrix hazakensis]